MNDEQRLEWVIRNLIAFRNMFASSFDSDEGYAKMAMIETVLNHLLLVKNNMAGKRESQNEDTPGKPVENEQVVEINEDKE